MQQRLALARTAEHIARFAVLLQLPDVAADRLPAPDLSGIVVHAAAHVVAAVPLEPAARIVPVDPALALPFRQGLARIDTETIQRIVAPVFCEPGAGEPAWGKLV